MSPNGDTMTDYDTTEKVERTDKGYRVTVESTRGTGTRDQDKVKVEYRSEDMPSPTQLGEISADVTHLMEQRRSHQPDNDDE